VVTRLRILWRLCAVVAILPWALFQLEWSLHGESLDGTRPIRARHVRRFWRRILSVFGIKLMFTGAKELPGDAPRLLVANHQSVLDIAILGALSGGRVLSRADVEGWPLLGAGARAGGTIFVDRDDRRSGAKAIRAMRLALREGTDVTGFPEGVVVRGHRLKPFQRGVFLATKGLSAEVVPIGLVYEAGVEYEGIDFVTHMAQLAARPSTVAVITIGDSLGACTDARGSAVEAERAVQGLVDRSRAEAESLGLSLIAT